jgi:hypothetical protein
MHAVRISYIVYVCVRAYVRLTPACPASLYEGLVDALGLLAGLHVPRATAALEVEHPSDVTLQVQTQTHIYINSRT